MCDTTEGGVVETTGLSPMDDDAVYPLKADVVPFLSYDLPSIPIQGVDYRINIQGLLDLSISQVF